MFSPFQWTFSVSFAWVHEYNHWNGLLDWTTGLDYWTHPNCKVHLSAEQKLNVLIHSVNTDCSLQRLVWFPDPSIKPTREEGSGQMALQHSEGIFIQCD